MFILKVVKDKIPKDWSKSWLAMSVYKGKGDALECGLYRGIQMLEHVLKIFARIIKLREREKVQIDSIQFGFMGGKGTTVAIFIIKQLEEKYIAKKK